VRPCIIAGSTLLVACGASSQAPGEAVNNASSTKLYVTVYAADEIAVIDAACCRSRSS
jgi:hypothetical protein